MKVKVKGKPKSSVGEKDFTDSESVQWMRRDFRKEIVRSDRGFKIQLQSSDMGGKII